MNWFKQILDIIPKRYWVDAFVIVCICGLVYLFLNQKFEVQLERDLFLMEKAAFNCEKEKDKIKDSLSYVIKVLELTNYNLIQKQNSDSIKFESLKQK